MVEQERNKSAWRAARLSWRLLTPAEKRLAGLIAVASVFVSLLDTVALVGVMPLVSLIVDPEVLTSSRAMSTLHKLAGEPGYKSFVILLATAAVGLIAASVSANYLMMVVGKRFRVACLNRMAGQLMSRCVAAPYDWLLRQTSTELTHHVFTDVQHWGVAVQRMVSVISQVSLLVLVAGVVLTATALPGLIAMGAIGIFAAAVMRLTRARTHRLSALQRIEAARSFAVASEFLGGIKDVKLSGREHVFVGDYRDSFDTVVETMGNLKILLAIPNLVMLFMGQSGIILIAIALWGYGKSSGEIATEMALVLLVTSRAIPAVTKLGGEISGMWNIFPAVEGINRLLAQLPPLAASHAKASTGAPTTDLRDWGQIELVGLGYRYSSERAVAIYDIDAKIERGKSYGVVGPTGAGKTTFVDLLLGLLHPTEGEIKVDGVSLTTANSRAWQRGIGYVPQNPLIANDTLLANVAFGLPAGEVDEARALHCIDMANLADVLESVTLHGDLGESGNFLSGGQRQRIAIARALYDNPDLLVFDEATSSLDTLSERAILGAVEKLRGKVTTITIAHRFSAIERCDEILVLDRGRLVARGPYDELLRTSPLFAAMVVSGNGDEPAQVEEQVERVAGT